MREYPVKKSKKIDGINVKPHVLMFFQWKFRLNGTPFPLEAA